MEGWSKGFRQARQERSTTTGQGEGLSGPRKTGNPNDRYIAARLKVNFLSCLIAYCVLKV